MKITEKFLLSCEFRKEPSGDSPLFRGHGIMIWNEGKRWVMRTSVFSPDTSRIILYKANTVSEFLENLKKITISSVCSSLEPLYLEQ